jgi:cellobiose-specific phosphotransferase system component IIA
MTAARHLHRAASMRANCKTYRQIATEADSLVIGVGNADQVKETAASLVREHKWREANDLLDRAVQAAPSHKQLLRRRAHVLAVIEEEDYRTSVEKQSEQALRDDRPDIAVSILGRSVDALQGTEHRAAIEERLRQAKLVEASSEDLRSMVHEAEQCVQEQRAHDAQKLLESASDAFPQSARIRQLKESVDQLIAEQRSATDLSA